MPSAFLDKENVISTLFDVCSSLPIKGHHVDLILIIAMHSLTVFFSFNIKIFCKHKCVYGIRLSTRPFHTLDFCFIGCDNLFFQTS